uniref:AAA+ ATPase domain-containing protein n=1 Tax=viral metagenome TaxID=1070528 RepID=A0A6C0B952_9ZZZZ
MYLILLNLFVVTSFTIKHRFLPNRIIINKYNGNNDNNLRKIDEAINYEKIKMKKLLTEKNKIMQNITGLNLHNETFIQNYIENVENVENENIYDDFDEDGFNNEYDYEFKPRSNKINIIINTNPMNQNPNKEKKGDNIQSENFQLIQNSSYTFNNIGGYESIKEELMQCADILLNYTKYAKYNVRIPKGIILEGPPGNGKTLMAKCFSGEINIGFIPVSGAQFQEKFVGVGASRVRELFDLATENVPCIIFIDELDALGRKRSSDQNSNTEHDSTLNELLVNLDGFKSANGIFIIGATNRIDLLDTALIRPGRIDKKIYIGNPDEQTRKDILKIHLVNKPIEPSITIDYLVELTNGFSGAQIENLLNEAMLYVLRQNRYQMDKADINIIANRILVGFQSNKNQLTEDVIYQVAVHEIGHALIGLFTKYRKLIKITINLFSPKTLGFTLFEPASNTIQTKEQLIQEIMVLLGGRIAEEIIFKNTNISSGASHDIQEVKKIAEQMIVHLGMGDKIVISDPTKINAEIDNIISVAYDRAKIILTNTEPLIKDAAKLLTIHHELIPEVIINLIKNKYPYINM